MKLLPTFRTTNQKRSFSFGVCVFWYVVVFAYVCLSIQLRLRILVENVCFFRRMSVISWISVTFGISFRYFIIYFIKYFVFYYRYSRNNVIHSLTNVTQSNFSRSCSLNCDRQSDAGNTIWNSFQDEFESLNRKKCRWVECFTVFTIV